MTRCTIPACSPEDTTVVDKAKHSCELPLNKAKHPCELPLKEALYIHMTPAEECLNRDTRLEVPGCWMAALRK